MNIIIWLIFGALAGWIASLIAKTNAQQGWIMNIVMGILGAFIGGAIWNFISGDSWGASFNIGSLIIAIVGALILTFAVSAVTGRKV
jgi:uncharacterized membrane protein YeaQ/YmgE (transglycosylase-associated protein family)